MIYVLVKVAKNLSVVVLQINNHDKNREQDIYRY